MEPWMAAKCGLLGSVVDSVEQLILGNKVVFEF